MLPMCNPWMTVLSVCLSVSFPLRSGGPRAERMTLKERRSTSRRGVDGVDIDLKRQPRSKPVRRHAHSGVPDRCRSSSISSSSASSSSTSMSFKSSGSSTSISSSGSSSSSSSSSSSFTSEREMLEYHRRGR